MSEKRVVIVGGGITGLACAYALVRDGGAQVTVLESKERLGGNIHTERRDGFVIDSGPDAWVVNKPDATHLARELGLEGELASTIEENRRVYIAWDGALHPMPEGLVLGIPTEMAPFVKTPLLSVEGKIRAGFDLFIPPRRFEADDDESVGDFIARRMGEEVSDRLVAPLLGGIFAGDAYSISVRAAFAQLVDAEAKYGSLIRAMRASRKQGGAKTRPAPSAFVSLASGMGALVDAVAAAVEARGGSIRRSTSVARVRRRDAAEGAARFAVELARGEVLDADEVVLAMPTRASARVVADLDVELAEHLGALMGYASTAAVFLAFDREAVRHPLDATGFIVPRTESHGGALVAGTFVTSKWAGRAPEGKVLFRAFLGGPDIERLLEQTDDQLAARAREELARFVPVDGAPLFTHVVRHVLASPQPTVGHHRRRAAMRNALARVPGLHVAASGVEGVGIPDCVKQANAIASTIRGSER